MWATSRDALRTYRVRAMSVVASVVPSDAASSVSRRPIATYKQVFAITRESPVVVYKLYIRQPHCVRGHAQSVVTNAVRDCVPCLRPSLWSDAMSEHAFQLMSDHASALSVQRF